MSMVTMISVLVSEADGSFRVISIGANDLPAMQKLVGGYIQILPDPTGDEFTVICNEEGKNEGLALNPTATRFMDVLWIYRKLPPFSSFDVLVGPVVFCGGINRKGDSTTLRGDMIEIFAGNAFTVEDLKGMDSPLTSVVRHGNDVWIHVSDGGLVVDRVIELTEAARRNPTHEPIEVWPSVDPSTLDELKARLTRENPETLFH
jgi:uncharacterized protein DUF3846